MWVQNQYPEEDLEILLRKLNDHMSQKVGSELPNEEVMQILENLYKAFFSHIQVVLDNMKEHHKLVICANKVLTEDLSQISVHKVYLSSSFPFRNQFWTFGLFYLVSRIRVLQVCRLQLSVIPTPRSF